jgi:hypothetical protein
MTADRRSFPEPPGQSKVRVLHAVEGVALTNQPDADRLAPDLISGTPSLNGSCLPRVFKGFGLLIVGFGGVVQVHILIATVFFDTPMRFNGQLKGKMESVVIEVGFLALWVAFGAVWLFIIGKVFPGRKRYWRLDLGDEDWVLRQGNLRWVLGRVSPREIEGLVVDRQGRVVAETTAGKRRTITGPMSPFESAWAVRALSGLLGQSSGAGRIADSTIHACVPTVDPAASPGSTLKFRLSRIDRPWRAALGCLVVTLLWNGVTWLFVWVQPNGMDPRQAGWKGWLFLAPFILIGVAALAVLAMNLFQAINDTRAGTAVVEVSMNPLEPGRPCQVFVSGQSALTGMVVRLVCEEEVKYGTGSENSPYTTESKRVRELELYRGDGLSSVAGLPFETTFAFEVPADAMHSLEVEDNKITWKLEVEGGPGDPPRFHREFAVVVNPPVRPEPCHE